MKRFVTYLYEYDQTIRGRNVGFIRNDIRNDRCRMEIHIRGLERIKEKAPIYIIVRDDDCIGIPAGEIVISQGVGNACLELRGDHIGKTNYSVSNIQAVVVRYGGGKMLLGCYVQHPAGDLLSGTFTKWESQTIPERPTPDPDATRGADDNFDATRPDSQIPRGVNDDSSSSRPDSHSPRGADDNFDATRPNPEITRGIDNNSNDIYPNNQNNSGINDNSDKIYPLEQNLQGTEAKNRKICPDKKDKSQPPTYKRIAITDIRSLPSRNWHLCNNSFLVHGFFCYHYLVLKTVNAPDGAKMYLGVPGIYAQQERMMALLFGFNDFETVSDNMADTHQTSDKKSYAESQFASSNKTMETSQPSAGSFGYWLCPLET